jgi:hypothetical protein
VRLAPLAAVVALAGCGADPVDRRPDDRRAAQQALTGHERRLLRAYEGRIQTHCVRVARSLVDPAARPTPEQERGAFAAADLLAGLVARKPRAELDVGQDLRLYLSDVIENLEGSNCDPRMITRLEQSLAEIRAS